jgi:hypothetical protein
MGGQEAFLLGLGGGLAAEFLAVLPYRRTPVDEWPRYLRSLVYWGFAIIMIGMGGLLAYLLTTDRSVTPYLAFHTGVATPLLLERMAANLPDFGPGSVN